MMAATVLSLLAVERELVLQSYNIDSGVGARYVYDLAAPTFPFLLRRHRRDGRLEPALAMKEDGQSLSPRLTLAGRAPEAVLKEIEAEGRGRHAYLDNRLQFSASDSTDPRRNGRYYYVAYTLELSRTALWALLTLGALVAMAALVALWGRGKNGEGSAS